MTWGFFSVLHILTILLAAGIITTLYFVLRNKSAKTQIITLLICTTICIWNVMSDFVYSDSILTSVPFHLCGLNAVILPFAIATRNKTLNNLLLLWSLGALAAIVVNTAQADCIVPSEKWIRYYFSHVFEFGIPILMFGLGLVKKDYKCILSTMSITLVVYTLVHMYNYLVTTYTEFSTNYMYSMHPENPIFDLFYKWVPHSYWYLMFVIPIALVYLNIIYSKQIFNAIKMHRLEHRYGLNNFRTKENTT